MVATTPPMPAPIGVASATRSASASSLSVASAEAVVACVSDRLMMSPTPDLTANAVVTLHIRGARGVGSRDEKPVAASSFETRRARPNDRAQRGSARQEEPMMQLARMTIAVAGIHVAIGCGNDAGSPPDGAEVAVDAGPSDAMPTPDAEPAAAMIDCTAANGTCATIAIAGDAPAAGSARGFADPSMRAAPTGSRIWLAYSWPRARSLPSGGGVVTVDSHLAHSDDGGATWAFDGPMWTSA